MTTKEARNWLGFFSKWDHGQVSQSFTENGIRTSEDDIYDARRALLILAYAMLLEEVTVRRDPFGPQGPSPSPATPIIEPALAAQIKAQQGENHV